MKHASLLAVFAICLLVIAIVTGVPAGTQVTNQRGLIPVVSFTVDNPDNRLVGDSDQYTNNFWLAGGNLRLNASASYDPQAPARPLEYSWDFGDGTKVTTLSPTIRKTYQAAGVFQVRLTVKNGRGLVNTSIKTIDLSLQPGDLIFCRSSGSVGSLQPEGYYTHVGMYVGDQQTVESTLPQRGVHISPLSRWSAPKETDVVVMRVNTRESVRQRAALWALSKVGLPYDKDPSQRDAYDRKYYCSELVWASIYEAANHTLDLGNLPPGERVSPDDLFHDSRLSLVGFHRENVF